jgi:hypothetical protein
MIDFANHWLNVPEILLYFLGSKFTDFILIDECYDLEEDQRMAMAGLHKNER